MVALVVAVVLLEACLISEAGSGGHGKSAGPSPCGGALEPWLVAAFLMSRGPFFRASGPVYGLPSSRSSKCRNCKQMTGWFMGWAHHYHSLPLCSYLPLGNGSFSFLEGTVFSKLSSFLTPQSNGFLPPDHIFLPLDHIFLNLSASDSL